MINYQPTLIYVIMATIALTEVARFSQINTRRPLSKSKLLREMIIAGFVFVLITDIQKQPPIQLPLQAYAGIYTICLTDLFVSLLLLLKIAGRKA